MFDLILPEMTERRGGIKKETSVAVIGGGLVGPLHAILLAQKGLLVDLYEARHDIRQLQHVGGRNINISLSGRGREALRAAGLEDAMIESGVPMIGLMIHVPSGETHVTYSPLERRANLYTPLIGGS